MAGLVGAQRTELMEGLFGLRNHTDGRITYKGQEIKIAQPKDAINSGIAMLTEDRRATGILGVLSIADNVSIASLNQYLIGGFMLDDGKIEKLVQENVAKLSIKTPSSKTQIQSLSGGNQQKVLISRWPTVRMSLSWMNPHAVSMWGPNTKFTVLLLRWRSRAKVLS